MKLENHCHLKQELLQACQSFVAERNHTLSTIIESAKKSLYTETKSSAGDKHETGRAMVQLEMEKASQQFEVISKMQEVLGKIKRTNKNEIAKLGSLICTSQANYFLAISVGHLKISGNDYYIVSALSPIGQLLLGKSKGASFVFNRKEIEILEVY